MIDSLLKAFYPSESDMNPFGTADVNQLLQSFMGEMGGPQGSPYGMYGEMYSGAPNMTTDSVLKQFAPGGNPNDASF